MNEYKSIKSMMNTSEPATMESLAGANPFTVEGRAILDDMAFAEIQKDLSLFSREMTQ